MSTDENQQTFHEIRKILLKLDSYNNKFIQIEVSDDHLPSNRQVKSISV